MNDTLLIWGTGGHGKVVLDVARSMGLFEHISFLDDDSAKTHASFCECSVLGGRDQLPRFATNSFVIAIGDNRTRSQCFRLALENGLVPATLVHSTAIVAASATLGRGTVIMPGVIVNAGAVIGDDCILNTGSVIEHDCRVDAHVHISPRVVLGGAVNIGPLAHVGIGAVVLPGATVGEAAMVGAGAVVLKHAPPNCTVVGVPAKSRLIA